MNTKKDYVRAAEIVRSFNDYVSKAAAFDAFSEFFFGENPRFDKQRFYDAAFKGAYTHTPAKYLKKDR